MTQKAKTILLQNVRYLFIVLLMTNVFLGFILGLSTALDNFPTGSWQFISIIALGFVGLATIAYSTAQAMISGDPPEKLHTENNQL